MLHDIKVMHVYLNTTRVGVHRLLGCKFRSVGDEHGNQEWLVDVGGLRESTAQVILIQTFNAPAP